MLIGNKVILEEVMPESIEQLRKWRNDPQLRQYFREWKDITPSMQEKWYSERGNNSNPNHVYFQIMAKSKSFYGLGPKKKRLVGCCGLLFIQWDVLRSAELSFFIGNNNLDDEFKKEVLVMLLNYGFNKMNLNKIWGEVYEFNRYIDLYRKIGFKDDAIFRDNCFHNGKYWNSFLISVLQREWWQKC